MENYNNMNANANAMDENREIGWGEEIVGEEQQFVLLPEGDYDFIVDGVNYNRKKMDDGTTVGFSEIICRVKTLDGDVIVKSNIKLVQKMMWKITEFFVCLGMGQVGQKFKTDWPATRGRTGKLKITHREYNKKTYHQVDKFLPPVVQNPQGYPAPVAAAWTPTQGYAPQQTPQQTPQQQPWNTGRF